MNEENTSVKKFTSAIDWPLIISLIITALILAVIVFGMKKSGIKIMKDVAANV